MLKPKFAVKETKTTPEYSEFSIEPLNPGYGHTLGNALRRVLLSSIPGAAITSVKIQGIRHKFTTLPGLKENIVDFLLNIKGLVLKLLNSKKTSQIKLSVKGPKKILASDLELSEDIEVVNKDHYLGYLSDKKAKLEMELTVEEGLGYSLASERKIATVGVIPTDALFSPVRRVSHEVFATRVGRQTDLDKLVLKIWTNGMVSPRQALEHAASILSSYFLQIYKPRAPLSEGEEDTLKQSISDNMLKLTIDELDLPTRIYNSLRNGEIETLGQLIKQSRKNLLGLRNMGNKSIGAIEERLKDKGLSLTE